MCGWQKIKLNFCPSPCYAVVLMPHNGLRIYEVRLNEISNYKQMLVGVSCIYAVMSSKFYENVDRNIK